MVIACVYCKYKLSDPDVKSNLYHSIVHPTVASIGYIAGGIVAALLVLSLILVCGSVLVYYFGWRKKQKTRELDFTCCMGSVTVSDFEAQFSKCDYVQCSFLPW